MSREAYEKFMQSIQKQIDDADRSSKEKAASIIKAMTDNYNNAISQRIMYNCKWQNQKPNLATCRRQSATS